MIKKSLQSLLLIFVCIFTLSLTAYAGSHTGSYDMTGGIFYKKSFNSGTSLTIRVAPSQGSPSCNMGLYTAKKMWYGYDGADFIANVSSVSTSSTRYTTTQNVDGIYFRNWAGSRWYGSFTVSW